MKKNKIGTIIKFIISILDIIPITGYTLGYYIGNIWGVFNHSEASTVVSFALLNTIVTFLIFILIGLSLIISIVNLIVCFAVKYNKTLNLSSNILLLIINILGFIFGAEAIITGDLESRILIFSVIIFIMYLIFDLISILRKSN